MKPVRHPSGSTLGLWQHSQGNNSSYWDEKCARSENTSPPAPACLCSAGFKLLLPGPGGSGQLLPGCSQGSSGSSSLPEPTLLLGQPLMPPSYSQTTRHLTGRQDDQPHPINIKAASASEHREVSSSALPFGRGEDTDLPKVTQQVIRASTKMQETWVPISLSSYHQVRLLQEALEGIVVYQSCITTDIVSQLMQSLAKVILERAVSVREGSPVLAKLFLENNTLY